MYYEDEIKLRYDRAELFKKAITQIDGMNYKIKAFGTLDSEL